MTSLLQRNFSLTVLCVRRHEAEGPLRKEARLPVLKIFPLALVAPRMCANITHFSAVEEI